MKISNHRLDSAYEESPNTNGSLKPKIIVMHYTAGYTAQSAIDILTKKGGKSSAHVVVDLDGTITQLVDFDQVAWHAGPSVYKGYKGLNQHSIGIEIVNIGFLKKLASGKLLDSYGSTVSSEKFEDLVEAKNAKVGSDTYYWPTYPEDQLKQVEVLTKLLIKEYGITDIVTHEDIDTRGWKTDPGPAFPMKRFIKLLDKDDRNLDKEPVEDPRTGDFPTYSVSVDKLNVRTGPGINYPTKRSLGNGEYVTGYKLHKDWLRISSGHLLDDEWVHTKYLTKV